jgi:hypothetical protein
MTRNCWILLLTWFLSNSALMAQPDKVLIIRHAEKPDQGHCLSGKGWQRAAALVPFFLGELSDECGKPQGGFARPVAIYAQKPTENNKSRRPFQTVQGLADALKLEINGREHDNVAEMVKEIKASATYKGQTVLICWEHHGNEDIAREFGVENPPKWHGSSFDRVWSITFEGDKVKLNDIPQQLLYGDSSE